MLLFGVLDGKGIINWECSVMENSKNQRIAYLDALRVFSIFAMMFLHVAASDWSSEPVTSLNWQVFNIYDGLVRFCVPVFVMISGALFLNPNKKLDVKKLYKVNVMRIVTAFAFWSLTYALFTQLLLEDVAMKERMKIFFGDFFTGNYHMWFLFMIVGLYMILPFTKKIFEDKKITENFITLAFAFSLLVPFAQRIVPFSYSVDITNDMHLDFFGGYTVFFIVGGYLSQYALSDKMKKMIYLLGMASVLFTIVATSIISVRKGEPIATLYEYLLPTTAFTAAAVFLFFKDCVSNMRFIQNPFIVRVSNLSFGMYLVHVFFLIVFGGIGLRTTRFNPFLSVPVITVCVFACSFVAIVVFEKIPLAKKYFM